MLYCLKSNDNLLQNDHHLEVEDGSVRTEGSKRVLLAKVNSKKLVLTGPIWYLVGHLVSSQTTINRMIVRKHAKR